MKFAFKFIIYGLGMTNLWSCNQDLRFSGESSSGGNSPLVVIPTTPPTVIPIAKSQGTCAADSSSDLTSCLKCVVPPLPPQAPQLSAKAQALLDIMTLSCEVTNKSDPSGYVAPNRATLLAKINRCSPTLYPDSTLDSGQQSVVENLRGSSDILRKKMFGKLWYNPPYSNSFETYFGLEIREVRDLFCYQTGGLVGPLLDAGYYTAPDPWSYKPPQEYVAANVYRTQLNNCLRESFVRPWVAPAQRTPPVCRFESISGESGLEIQEQIRSWLARGWKVSGEASSQGLCLSITSGEELKNVQGLVKAAAYHCE